MDAVINLTPATFRRATMDEQTMNIRKTDFKQNDGDERKEITLSFNEYSAAVVTDEKTTKEAKIEIQNFKPYPPSPESNH